MIETLDPPADTRSGEIVRLHERSQDYARMGRALEWLAARWHERPSLDRAAAAAGLSPHHFQRLFTRWAGVSPKTFNAALVHAEARRLLEDGASVLDAALDAGLSGPSRLHDLFVVHEAATPGQVRARGEGMELTYGYAPTPFGRALFVVAPRGLAGLAFSDPDDEAGFEDMRRRWPAAAWGRDDAVAESWAVKAFGARGRAAEPLPLVLYGPPFQVQVWKALLRIPAGSTTTYSDVAEWAGKPGACRATGAAVGANPISFLIPCHRVLARDGRLTGYHWGTPRKAAMLAWEAAR